MREFCLPIEPNTVTRSKQRNICFHKFIREGLEQHADVSQKFSPTFQTCLLEKGIPCTSFRNKRKTIKTGWNGNQSYGKSQLSDQEDLSAAATCCTIQSATSKGEF